MSAITFLRSFRQATVNRAATLALAAALAGAAINAQAQAAEIKIGLLIATTGAYAFAGAPIVTGAELAADQLTSTKYFGDDTLSLIKADNGSTGPQAVTLLNRMAIRDKALVVIGPVSLTETMSAGPFAAEVKVPIISVSNSSTATALNPWVFRAGQKFDYLNRPLADYAGKTLGVKRCISIADRDNESYVYSKNVFNNIVKEYGAAIIDDESVVASDADFSALSTKIVYAKPDCLFVSLPPEQGANFIIQAKQAGLSDDVKIFGNTGMSAPNFVKTGGQAVEGTYFPAVFIPSGVNEVAKHFIETYQAKYGVPPDEFAAVGYSLVLVAANAVREASPNPTPEKVRDALAKTANVPVPIGQGAFTIDPDREPIFGASVLVVRNGKSISP